MDTNEQLIALLCANFFHRRDYVSVQMTYEGATFTHPQPVPAKEERHLIDLLNCHVRGLDASPVTVTYQRKNAIGAKADHWRVGTYFVKPEENTVSFLCIDVDDHEGNDKAPEHVYDAAASIIEAFQRHGAPAYFEKSGGGKGWHIWVFFEEPIPAIDARRFAWQVIPPYKLKNGEMCVPSSNHGIEVFPKQNKVTADGYGNMVWLPFWWNAKEGGAQFYDHEDRSIWMPDEFERTPMDAIADVIERYNSAESQKERKAIKAPVPAPRIFSDKAGNQSLRDWRDKALQYAPITTVYGEWLTGKESGNGWLEMRDPSSATGDRRPSAGVANNVPGVERGTFHSFRDARNLSIFDFMIEQGQARDFGDAIRQIADVTNTPLPRRNMEIHGDTSYDARYGVDSEVEEGLTKASFSAEWSPPTREPLNLWKASVDEPPPKRWLFNNTVPLGIIAGIFSRGGLGKGWFTQALVMSVATGETIFPSFVPAKPMPVLWFTAEDGDDEIKWRQKALWDAYCLPRGVGPLLESNVRTWPLVKGPLVQRVQNTYKVVATEMFLWVLDQIAEFQPRLIIFDPLSKYLGVEENSNPQCIQYMNFLELFTRVADNGGSTVWINHHTAKEREGSAESASGRGASAIRDSMRTCFSMVPLSDKQQKAIGATKASLYVVMRNTKNNYAPDNDDTIYLRRDGGVLREEDMKARKRQIANDVANQMVAFLVEEIGANPEDLSVRDISRAKNSEAGKAINEAFKQKFGKGEASVRDIEDAINRAIGLGALVFDTVATGARPRMVPRAVPEGQRVPVEDARVKSVSAGKGKVATISTNDLNLDDFDDDAPF